jgi:hypothetical protein
MLVPDDPSEAIEVSSKILRAVSRLKYYRSVSRGQHRTESRKAAQRKVLHKEEKA